MSQRNHHFTASQIIASWEDDGGAVPLLSRSDDLNSLLAQEQTAIMSANSAGNPTDHGHHRDEAKRVRLLVNQMPYPNHAPHVFDRDGAFASQQYDEDLDALKRRVAESERLLTMQFADGEVSLQSYQHRSRVIRQERRRASFVTLPNTQTQVNGWKV